MNWHVNSGQPKKSYLLLGSQPQSLSGLNDGGTDDLNNLNLNAGVVSSRAVEEPLVTSSALFEITNGSKFDGRKRRNNLEGRHFSVQLLTRIQGERRLRGSDFLISMAQLHLAVFVTNNCTVLVSKGLGDDLNDPNLTIGLEIMQ